jgi:glutathione S-transferase
MAGELPVLHHLRPSNFNEKARWALDYKGIPHRRKAAYPGMHMPIALRLTRRSITFPVLQIDGNAISNSARIIAELEERFPEPPLYPADPEARRRALELEEHFDAHLGPHVRAVGFWELTKNPEYIGLGGWRNAAFSRLVKMRYGINERSAAASLAELRASLDLIEQTLDGGDHLVGDDFTVADLTAAALTAPMLRPPKLPYNRADTPVPPSLQPIVAEVRDRPAGQWILRTYERYRPPSAEVKGDAAEVASAGARG